MQYRIILTFLHDELGRLNAGDVVSMTARQALSAQQFGFVESLAADSYETKVVDAQPEPPKRRRKPAEH